MSIEQFVTIPRDEFTQPVFEAIVRAYCTAANVQSPLLEMASVVAKTDKIKEELMQGHTWCHNRLGSELSHMSTLVLVKFVDNDTGAKSVGVIFETNAEDDDGPRATQMRADFYAIVSAYVETLKK